MSVPYTDAWAEAEASCPVDVLVFNTIELQHVAFLEMGSPIALRFVLDAEPRNFGIEAGALFNPGSVQAFRPAAFQSSLPTFAEGRMPECTIAVDNVARYLTPYLNAAVQVRADLVVVFRQYRSDDLSAPCYGPVEFRVRNVRILGTRVEGTASLADLPNMLFPDATYSRAAFPALQQG